MGNQVPSIPNEGFALAARNTNLPLDSHRPKKGGRPWCDHCRRPGHTKDNCWKLHGKPRNPTESHSFMSTEEVQPEAETSVSSKEQIELLQKLISQ